MIETIIYNGIYNSPHQAFQCESLSDIDTLPTQTKPYKNKTAPTGSLAIIEKDFSVWILTIAGKWEKFV